MQKCYPFLIKISPFVLPIMILSLVFCTVYVVTQQTIRQGANDPQIQMAEDAAAQFEAGGLALDIVPKDNVDLQKSLAPFIIIYDEQGKPLQSSGSLNGTIPIPPQGVFDYTRSHGEERITWQPERGVRSAIVIKYMKGNTNGFVLVGRSLREVERCESFVTLTIFIAWLASIVLSILGILAVRIVRKQAQT